MSVDDLLGCGVKQGAALKTLSGRCGGNEVVLRLKCEYCNVTASPSVINCPAAAGSSFPLATIHLRSATPWSFFRQQAVVHQQGLANSIGVPCIDRSCRYSMHPLRFEHRVASCLKHAAWTRADPKTFAAPSGHPRFTTEKLHSRSSSHPFRKNGMTCISDLQRTLPRS